MLRYDRIPVPVHLYIESRRNSRISLLKTRANVRLPKFLTKHQRQAELERLLDWAEKHIEKRGLYPHHEAGSHIRDYRSEGAVTIAGEQWRLEFTAVKEGRMRASLLPAAKSIRFRGDFEGRLKASHKEEIRMLLIKLFLNYYRNNLINLVSEINDKTFGFSYNSVRLKYLKSRWGSCSGKRNINLSLRLLLLPDEIRDYVIIHELAHLREMNHSKAFWSLVEQHDPNYREHEKWLNKNGHLYDL